MSRQKYILALDQGTTSSRAIVFDHKGAIAGLAQQEFRQIYPRQGWVEHDPEDILGSQLGVIAEALVRAKITARDLAAIGITNQRETALVWDRSTGAPVCNAIVWQCRRTAEICDRLKAEGVEGFVYDKTGLMIDAYFSATKIAWILDHAEGARARAERGELCFGTVDTYLMWSLSKGKIFATDYTNASRTMLFDIHSLDWDEDLLKLFGIPRAMLPEVRPSCGLFGYADEGVIGARVPICGAVGDQQAALFGQLCTEKGMSKNTYGTGCFLLVNTGDRPVASRHGLITTLAASADGKAQYALEGSVFVGGAVVQWLRDELRVIRSAAESEALALSVPDSGGVYVVPAFVGLGAPHWDPRARGLIAGITRGTRREHVVRAALEAIAYQVFDVLHAMERDLGVRVDRLNVDGGASANNFLMQFQADILGAEVVRPRAVETTALGACYLAGLAAGFWSGLEEIRQNAEIGRVFVPGMEEQRRKELLLGWEVAVGRARYR